MAIGLMYWPGVILPQRGQARHLFDGAAGTPAPGLAHAATTTESP